MILKDVILNTRLWIFLAGAIFLLILGLSIAGHVLASRLQVDPSSSRTAGIFIKSVFLLLTIGLAYCLVPIMVRVVFYFIEVLLEEIGLEAIARVLLRFLPAKLVNIQVLTITFLLRHQAEIVLIFWAVWLIGLLIASPYIVRDFILSKDQAAAAFRVRRLTRHERTVMILLIVVAITIVSTVPTMAQGNCWDRGRVTDTQGTRIQTCDDEVKDRTTVQLGPLQVSGEKGKFVSLHISASFSYPGQKVVTPEWLNFELLSVVKGRKLKIDLFVRLVADGETFILSSRRSAVKNVIPGRKVIGERIIMRMPYETFVKIAGAKRVAIKMDEMTFELQENHLQSLRTLAGRMTP